MSKVFMYESSVIFLSKEDAREFFKEKKLDEDMSYEYSFNEYLKDHYRYEEVFAMSNEEKEEVIEEYGEYLADMWIDEDLIEVELYEPMA